MLQDGEIRKKKEMAEIKQNLWKQWREKAIEIGSKKKIKSEGSPFNLHKDRKRENERRMDEEKILQNRLENLTKLLEDLKSEKEEMAREKKKVWKNGGNT